MLDRVPASLAAVAAPAIAKAVPAAAPASSGLMKWLPWLAALIGAYLLWQAFSPKAPAPVPAAPPAASAPAPAAALALPASVYFELDKFDIGAEGSKTIAAVVAQVSKDGKYAVTGYTDKTGDPARNEELAKNRAKAVKDAMVAAGVPEANVTMQPPEYLTGSYEDRAARRVDINKAN
jgi:cytochrome c oxidase subunit 2